jgi:hypothetical protein
MCKKASIAALAVLVGVGVVSLSSPKLWRHIKFRWNRVWTNVESRISPEDELDRLEADLKKMKAEDRRFEDQNAKLALAVEKAEAKVLALDKVQAERKERIDSLNAALTSVTSGDTVVYKDKERSRPVISGQLKYEARQYLDGQVALKTAKEGLKIRRDTLAQSQDRLRELRVAREKAEVKLEQLRNALMEERRAQAAGEAGDDGGKMAQWTRDFDAVQDQVKLMQKRRQGTPTTAQGPLDRLEAAEKQKGDPEVDTFLRGLNNPQPNGAQTKR